ncbi:MAG: hypothetical protein N838_10210 [Thiohalocapsa sp. PB-PSB1]|jgi:acyl-CoA thioesterase FadM|nr:MAG: hypothetical protein N838_10210 [Thiohalocapsa sp. PB-PSB1]
MPVTPAFDSAEPETGMRGLVEVGFMNWVSVDRMNDTHDAVVRLLVRPNDIDRLGHVNNAVVLEYCEAGRQAWLRENGIKVGTILPVVARAEIDFQREIGEGEVQVRTSLAEYGTYSATFVQTIDVNGQVACRAKIQVGFIHSQSRSVASGEEFFQENAS